MAVQHKVAAVIFMTEIEMHTFPPEASRSYWMEDISYLSVAKYDNMTTELQDDLFNS